VRLLERFLMSSRTVRIWLGSRPMVGSSRMSKSGSVHEGISQADALAIALREGADELLLAVLDLAQFNDIPHPLADLAPGHTLEGSAVAEVFAHAHVGIERGILRQIANVPPGLHALLENVALGNLHAPGRGGHVAGEDLHRRALARPIGPQKTHDLPFRHLEADVVHGCEGAVFLCQVLDADHAVVQINTGTAAFTLKTQAAIA